MGCGFPLLAPVLIAVAYEKLAPEPGDRLGLRPGRARHARPARRAQCGHRRVRPRGDAVAVRRRLAPADGRLHRLGAHDDRRCDSVRAARSRAALPVAPDASPACRSRLPAAAQHRVHRQRREPDAVTAAGTRARSTNRADRSGGVDLMFAERRAKIAVVSVEGPRMLRAGNWRRAAELCRAWTDLELANADSYRCLGAALQAQGYHQDAIIAFRKAKQYDPGDRYARCGDRPLAEGDRRGLPEPLPALSRAAHSDAARGQRRFSVRTGTRRRLAVLDQLVAGLLAKASKSRTLAGSVAGCARPGRLHVVERLLRAQDGQRTVESARVDFAVVLHGGAIVRVDDARLWQAAPRDRTRRLSARMRRPATSSSGRR